MNGVDGRCETVNQDEHTEVFQPVIQRAAHAPLQHNHFPAVSCLLRTYVVHTSGEDATGTTDRQGHDGAEASGLPLLDVAQGMDYAQRKKFGSHAGEPGKSPGCAVDRLKGTGCELIMV